MCIYVTLDVLPRFVSVRLFLWDIARKKEDIQGPGEEQICMYIHI